MRILMKPCWSKIKIRIKEKVKGITEILNMSIEEIEKLRLLLGVGYETERKEVVTLRIFADEYRELIKNSKSQNYYKSVTLSLRKLTNYFGAQLSISMISSKDIEKFLMKIKVKAPGGYVVDYRNLKAAFNKAVEWKYIKENNFLRVKLAKRNKVNPEFITEEDLWKIVDKIENELVKDFSVFAFYTGMRLGEIVNLKWKHIDWEKGIIVVGDEEFVTKGKKQRYVPICGEVERVLRKIKEKDASSSLSMKEHERKEIRDCSVVMLPQNGKRDFVFGKFYGGSYTGDYFSRRFKIGCRLAGMKDEVHFHTLRHSFASRLVQEGVNLYVVRDLLGHSTVKMTEIYSHLNIDSLRAAVSLLDEKKSNLQLVMGK